MLVTKRLFTFLQLTTTTTTATTAIPTTFMMMTTIMTHKMTGMIIMRMMAMITGMKEAKILLLHLGLLLL